MGPQFNISHHRIRNINGKLRRRCVESVFTFSFHFCICSFCGAQPRNTYMCGEIFAFQTRNVCMLWQNWYFRSMFCYIYVHLICFYLVSPFKLRRVKKIDWKTHVRRDQHNVIYQVMNKFSLCYVFYSFMFNSLSLSIQHYSILCLYVW